MGGRKLPVLLMCVLLMLGMLGACSPRGRGAEGEGEERIAVFISNGGDPYFQNKSYGYQLADEELEDAVVEVYDAGGYENITRQVNQLEDAVQRGVDGIVLTAVDATALCGTIEETLDAGIPIVVDDVLPACDFPVPAGISENSVNVGYQACKYMAEEIGGDGGFVMLNGPSGAKIAQDRAQGCKNALSEYPDIELLAEQWGPSNIETGTTLMEDFVSAHGQEIEAAYTFGAVTGLGAANALQAAGFEPGEVVLVTIDYHPEVIEYMEDGWIEGTIPAQPVVLAREAVEMAVQLARGEEPDGERGIDPCCEIRRYTADEYVVDMDNIDEYDSSPAVAPDDWQPEFRS
jgi:ribose transport system substrate-binding protein